MKATTIPTYSIFRGKDESFICTESLKQNEGRFRRFTFETDRGYDAYAANDAITALFKNRGKVSVEVNESDGIAIVHVGSKSVTGSISTL